MCNQCYLANGMKGILMEILINLGNPDTKLLFMPFHYAESIVIILYYMATCQMIVKLDTLIARQ